MRSGNGNDFNWVLADPQPLRSFGVLEGTVCQERGAHSMAVASTAHATCEVCGLVSFTLPEGMTEEEFERVQFAYEPEPIADD